MKIIRFKTTFHNTLKGAGNYPEKIGFVEIPLPNNIDEKDGYALTKYVEQTTNLMAIGYLEVIQKESAESFRNEETDKSNREPGWLDHEIANMGHPVDLS
jgi:hypothetical protein